VETKLPHEEVDKEPYAKHLSKGKEAKRYHRTLGNGETVAYAKEGLSNGNHCRSTGAEVDVPRPATTAPKLRVFLRLEGNSSKNSSFVPVLETSGELKARAGTAMQSLITYPCNGWTQ